MIRTSILRWLVLMALTVGFEFLGGDHLFGKSQHLLRNASEVQYVRAGPTDENAAGHHQNETRDR